MSGAVEVEVGTLVYHFPNCENYAVRFTCIVTGLNDDSARVEIEPVAGKGRAWVHAASIEPLSHAEARELVK